MAARPWRSRDLVGSLAVVLVVLVAYLAWPAARQYGDGGTLAVLFSGDSQGTFEYVHAGYLPLARGLDALLRPLPGDLSPGRVLEVLSVVGAAVGLGASFLVARGFGASRAAALVAVALAATSPVLLLFGRVAEVHAPHFAAAALLVAALLSLGRRSAVACLALVALGGPTLFLTHQSGLLLLPGVGLLAWLQLEHHHPGPLRARQVALALVLSLTLAIGASCFLRDLGPLDHLTSSRSVITDFSHGSPLHGLVAGFLMPLLLLWPPILAGLAGPSRPGSPSRLALLAFVLPPGVFFAWWALPEYCAYLLGMLPMLLALAALGIDRLLARATFARALPAVLVAQLVVGLEPPGVHAEGAEAHVGRAERLVDLFADRPTPAVLLTIDGTNQSIAAHVRGLVELRLLRHVMMAEGRGDDPDAWAWDLATWLSGETRGAGTLVLDRSYVDFAEAFPTYAVYVGALEEAAKPENNRYVYDWRTANCATKARDFLDDQLDGTLASQWSVPADTTAREQIRRHLGRIEKAMGALLILFALLIATNSVNLIAQWMLDHIPWVSSIG